jgi:hypothetical protein
MLRSDSRAERAWQVPLLLLVTVPAVLGIAGGRAQSSTDAVPLQDGVVYGKAVAVGNGSARSYVELRAGEPVEIGVALSEGALHNLPAGHAAHQGQQEDAHANMTEYLLELPAQAARTPFQFIELDWNPAGHEPPGIYDIPHFDFHFYTIPVAERNSIDPVDPAFQQKTEKLPPAGFMSANYVAPMLVAVPRMGLHWIDPASPELNGQRFTSTFIYGSWDGKTTFWEPMVTREFIMSRPHFETSVMQPEQVASAGFYPRGYAVRWNEGAREYRIALTGMGWRTQ